MTLEAEPLHSLELEMAAIGSALLGLDTAKQMRSILPHPGYFYRPAHQDMWKAILELMDCGLPVEWLFLSERLGDHLQNIGGEEYLTQIVEYVPSPDSGVYYAKQLAKYWAKREYMRILRSIDSETNLDELNIRLESVKNGVSMSQAVPVIQTLGTLGSDRPKGLPTCWGKLNELITSRGWPVGQFVVVRADTGHGKTPFMTQACIEAAKSRRKPLYASFADLDATELESRAMKYLTGWAHSPDKLDLNAWWHEERKGLRSLGIDVYDASSMESGFDVETFVTWLEHHQSEKGYTEIYLDYVQEMTTRKGGSILEQMTEVCRLIKATAKRLQIPAVAGSQITIGKDGQRDMAKGGRVADEKAAIVLDIKPNDENTGGEIRISKNRFGQRNVKLPYTFDTEKLRFIL